MGSLFGKAAPSQPTVAAATANVPRRALAVCLTPLLLLGVAGGVSALARTVRSHSARHGASSALMENRKAYQNIATHGPTEDRARGAADAFLTRMLGRDGAVENAALIRDYSFHMNTTVRQWSVLCDTSSGHYLLRINAQTRRVYAINHMDNTNFEEEAPRDVSWYGAPCEEPLPQTSDEATGGRSLSRNEAQGQAIHYLSRLGMPASSLKSISSLPMIKPSTPASLRVGRTYNFAFSDALHPGSSILIAVNGATGALQSLWSPSRPI